MAWEATQLLPLVLLVLLVSGSWEQQPELLRKLEGETIFMRCSYPPQKCSKMKVWCRKTAHICTVLVTHPGLRTVPRKLRYFIQDDPRLDNLIITMTELRMRDSGFYWCGTYESSRVTILKTIHQVVLQAPPGHWAIIFSVTVGLLLLLVLTFLMILFLSKAGGRARTGKDKSHHTYDTPGHENETVHRKSASPRQRESQLSWVCSVMVPLLPSAIPRGSAGSTPCPTSIPVPVLGPAPAPRGPLTMPRCDPYNGHLSALDSQGSDQQMGSGEDTGDIHYASLTHLNHFSPEDSIYVNTRPRLKPTPDPFLSVEYSSIAKNRPQHSKSAALEEEARI